MRPSDNHSESKSLLISLLTTTLQTEHHLIDTMMSPLRDNPADDLSIGTESSNEDAPPPLLAPAPRPRGWSSDSSDDADHNHVAAHGASAPFIQHIYVTSNPRGDNELADRLSRMLRTTSVNPDAAATDQHLMRYTWADEMMRLYTTPLAAISLRGMYSTISCLEFTPLRHVYLWLHKSCEPMTKSLKDNLDIIILPHIASYLGEEAEVVVSKTSFFYSSQKFCSHSFICHFTDVRRCCFHSRTSVGGGSLCNNGGSSGSHALPTLSSRSLSWYPSTQHLV